MVAKDTRYGSETYRPYFNIERIINVQSACSVNRGHDQLSKVQIILICKLLVDKNGIRAIERITGVHRDTVSDIVEDIANSALTIKMNRRKKNI